MARQSRHQVRQADPLAVVAELVTAADGDTLYRDAYLRRAAELLSPVVSRADYDGAVKSREQLGRLLAQARASVGRQDWQEVQKFGASAAGLQRSLDSERVALEAAEAVYSASPIALDPFTAGPTRLSKRWSDPARARAEVLAALAELVRDDAPAAALYTSRQRALEALHLPDAVASGGTKEATSSGSPELQALQALERGDAAALEGLAASMVERAGARPAGGGGPATARGRIAAPATLGEPLPDDSVSRARALGLERIEPSLVSATVAASISEFMERYALGASPAVRDQASEGVARLTITAEEAHVVPPEVAETFAENIGVFALHAYVNSAGIRYVPLPAPREVLLVETHPEDEEPVTPLLRALGLERRRAIARDEIEARLLERGADIVGGQLSLDPLAFRLVCLPPDLFVRVGRDLGWGKRQQWTHFDGYQVLSGGRLRALVGGNARYGGLFDLCSISRDDARENTVARFAVIRRDRLGVRIG